MNFLYKGNQLVAEVPFSYQTDGNLAEAQANWEEAIYWLYQDNDFTPTARYEKGQLHYTVSDQIGTITELMTEDGYIDYRQKLNLWGEAEIDGYRHYAANDSTPLKCNHRFVGQYYDEESGLHYNRFRYYSPETGQYVSSDPIGLLGGFNPYGYVGIPTAFVDPLGLAVCPTLKANYDYYRSQGMTARDAYAASKNNPLPVYQVDRTTQPNIADNIQNAISNGAPTSLNRTSRAQQRQNRAQALAGQPPRPLGLSLDEYPFASTQQGGIGATVKAVPVGEQNVQGGTLSAFYRQNNIQVGDQFLVTIVN